MAAGLLLKLLVAACAAAAATPSFDEFAAQFGRTYASAAARAARQAIYETNVRAIEQHNGEAAAGLHTYRLGVNQFADLTNAEFRARYLAPVRRPRTRPAPQVGSLACVKEEEEEKKEEGGGGGEKKKKKKGEKKRKKKKKKKKKK